MSDVIVDVVNLNADASCLPAAKWLGCMDGGGESLLCRSLRNYVRHRRKVNLGITGATLKDIASFNPEAIDMIRRHPETFEIVARPFAHDNSLLRIPEGFRFNVEAGQECTRRYFETAGDFYLAPEIMVTSEQIHILRELGLRGTFVHHGRYEEDIRRRIPSRPFHVRGVLGASAWCLPFTERDIESTYLRALHGAVPPEAWPSAISSASVSPTILWRDGESCFLLPRGVDHESRIFEAEAAAGVGRLFLSELPLAEAAVEDRASDRLRFFPMHSLRPWLNEMKLYWFTERVRDIERQLFEIHPSLRKLWLLLIDSDILSSVEKSSPVVDVSPGLFDVPPDDAAWAGVVPLPHENRAILSRSERAAEGEDYLAYYDLIHSGERDVRDVLTSWHESGEPHLLKAWARIADETF